MPQYLVAIHLLDNHDPSAEGEATVRDIASLNEEMIAAGVRTLALAIVWIGIGSRGASRGSSRRGLGRVTA